MPPNVRRNSLKDNAKKEKEPMLLLLVWWGFTIETSMGRRCAGKRRAARRHHRGFDPSPCSERPAEKQESQYSEAQQTKRHCSNTANSINRLALRPSSELVYNLGMTGSAAYIRFAVRSCAAFLPATGGHPAASRNDATAGPTDQCNKTQTDQFLICQTFKQWMGVEMLRHPQM
jgi:hypothetical protein